MWIFFPKVQFALNALPLTQIKKIVGNVFHILNSKLKVFLRSESIFSFLRLAKVVQFSGRR